MVIGVIDIGTNTTRLLVAEVSEERLHRLVERRHFIDLDAPGSLEQLPALLEREAAIALDRGADSLLAAGTAGLRRSAARGALDRICRRLGAGGLRVLTEADEARLAFLGATAAESSDPAARIAVADVGGGSTQIAVGRRGEQPGWWASRPIGSRRLTERARFSDPPSRDQVSAARNAASRSLVGVEPPRCDYSLAVGGGTTSLRRISGGTLDRESIAGLMGRLRRDSSGEVGADTGVAPQRVRLLPAALAILEAVCELVPEPLRIANGGVREGLALERARGMAAAESG